MRKSQCVRNSRNDQLVPNEDILIGLIGEQEEGLNTGVCYRPPALDSSVNTMLFKNIKQACQGGETIIMSDFNYPNINWNLATRRVKSEGRGICYNFFFFFFYTVCQSPFKRAIDSRSGVMQ